MGLLDVEPNADDLLEALAARRATAVPKFIDEKHKSQAAFLRDPSRLKAALCTRRAGKSYGAALAMCKTAYENPGCSVLYLALSRQSAEDIMWRKVLKGIDKKFDLRMVFNEAKLVATFPNGSIIRLAGADAKPDEADKFLGSAYKLVVIDEAASFHQDLKQIVYQKLRPATLDEEGTICMIGTPGNITRGLFFDVTNGREGGWKVYQWSGADNPYLVDKKGAHLWAKELAEIRRDRPREMETPGFKQMYLGQWVIDNNLLVYRFDAARNTYAGDLPLAEYSYVLGVDLGFNDATAFVVCAYSPTDKNLYVVHASSQSGLDFTATAERIKKLYELFPIDVTVVDGANKQGVEEMRKRHDLPLKVADKRGKEDFIRLMNADLTTGRIKVHIDDAANLRKEWEQLIWDQKKLPFKYVEHPNCPNHLCDAALYAWRHCYQYLSEVPAPTHEVGTTEYWDAEADRLEELAETLAMEELEPPEGISEPDW